MDKIGLFLHFLTTKGVIKTVYDICGKPIIGLVQEEDPEDYLISLFLFESRADYEGSAFWFKLQEEWRDLLENVDSGGAEAQSPGEGETR